MEPERFDQHVRRLSQAVSRRTGLTRLGTGLLALLGGSLAGEAAAKPVRGEVCLRLGKQCGRGKRRRKYRCCGAAKCRQGKCRCSSTQKACKGKCLSKSQCCRDGDCGGGGAICQNGRCRCPQGMQDCQGTCIPTDACCASGDCGACESCVDGQCVSGCQGGQECVSGTCRCTTGSCPGCCDGETCREGDGDGACGAGGVQCVTCGDHADCVGGACQCDAGFQDCEGTCIPDDECCGGCPSGEVCVDGTCVEAICGNGGPCTVFVRQDPVLGSAIGDLAGADALCQASAGAEGSLAPAGTYRAWLSDGTGSPASRFTHSPGPYGLVNGTVVAANWTDLTDGNLVAPINRSETGGEIIEWVWSNTTPAGLPASTDGFGSCGAWDGTLVLGGVGDSGAMDMFWTQTTSLNCTLFASHLYCFQQG